MRFRVTVSETATRQLEKIPKEVRKRVLRGLEVLIVDPFRPRPKADILRIEGTDPKKYRLRIGDYRAIYAVVDDEVRVIEVFARGRGYR
jgi:mRNA interferase RelE/StbE